MDIITSTTNQYVKTARSLKTKKFRDKLGLFLVEGENLTKDMPENVCIEYFLVSEKMHENFQYIFSKFNAKVLVVSDKIFDSIADTVSPQGIIAVVKKMNFSFVLPQKNALVLDKVSDCGNLGTILRTAAASGFEEIYLCESVDVFSPKVVRSSMGGLFKVKIMVCNECQAIDVLKNSNSYVLDMNGLQIGELSNQNQVTLLGGSESLGVRDIFKQNAKNIVSIPMKNKMESLNVAVAMAVAMYKTI